MDHLPCLFGIELTEEDKVSYVALDNYQRVPFLKYVKTNEATRLPQIW